MNFSIRSRAQGAVALFRERPIGFSLLAFAPGILFLITDLLLIFPGEVDCSWPYALAHISMLGFFLLPVYLALCIIGLVFTFRRNRRWPLLFLACSLLALGTLIPSIRLGNSIRMAAMASVANRGNDIVKAIEAYVTTNKQPPSALSDLVPNYIQKIPATGLCSYPEFEYKRDKEGYELRVFTPRLGINFDELLYAPNGPGDITDPVTKLDKWIYVHE